MEKRMFPMLTMLNFHLGWFTKKGPHKSPKNSVVFTLHFMKDFGTCGGPSLGGPTQVEN